jgi:hypothetical protein
MIIGVPTIVRFGAACQRAPGVPSGNYPPFAKRPSARLSQDSNISSKNFTDGTGHLRYFPNEGLAPVLVSTRAFFIVEGFQAIFGANATPRRETQ